MVSMMLSPRVTSYVSVAVGVAIVFVLLKSAFSPHTDNQFDDYYASDNVDGIPPVGQSHSSGVDFLASVGGKVPSWFGDNSVSKQMKTNEALYSELLAKRRKAIATYHKMAEPDARTLWPQAPGGGGDMWQTPWQIWDLTLPAWNCPHTNRRIGRIGDGGKWLCGLERLRELPKSRKSSQQASNHDVLSDDRFTGDLGIEKGHQPGCIIYSFGINDESSFEEDLMKSTPNCRIWGYDPTVDDFGPELRKHKALNRAFFLKAGLSGETDTAARPPFYSIQNLMNINGHDHIDVLKIDIEGGEFEAMKSVIHYFIDKGSELPIAQLQIELHVCGLHDIGFDDFIEWWELLEKAGFRPFFTEPNLGALFGPTKEPCFTEYSLLNIKDKRSPFI